MLGLSAGVWNATGWSAQIENATHSADPIYKPGAAYKKSISGSRSAIPGSSSVIQGSRSRTYLKPKKISYQEHLAALGSHRFKNDKSSFGSKTSGQSSVLSKHSASSFKPPSSRIKIQKSIGHKNPGIARLEPLTNTELVFLDKLTQTVRANDTAAGSKLAQITSALKRGQTLSKDDYDFLNAVAKKIDDGQATFRLHGIAEKRRDKGK